jgi:[ribosomal protein S5]-alanine N-acetyltransferase
MRIYTKRLIIREFEILDAEGLLNIKFDENVLKYNPEFIKQNANINDAVTAIEYFISQRDSGNFIKEIFYVVTLQESGDLIGVITVSIAAYLRETQIGWMFRSEFCGKGYASEAGCAVSDYILSTFNFEYMIVIMDVDNPASFRVAQKSGFKLFEKRVPYDYFYSTCNVENFDEVAEHFKINQAQVGSCYYYFRKYNPHTSKKEQYYGDTVYTGRFA